MALSLVTAATNPPLTLDLAKLSLRVTGTADDTLIEDALIPAAVDRAEIETLRQLVNAVWALKLDRFPCHGSYGNYGSYDSYGSYGGYGGGGYIELPRPPLVSVASISYIDTNGVTQVWGSSNYLVDAPAGPRCARGRITPAYGVPWPMTQCRMNAVTVQFTAGYGTDGTNVPALLKQGLLIDLGTLYEHRQDIMAQAGLSQFVALPNGSKSIYGSFRSYPRQ